MGTLAVREAHCMEGCCNDGHVYISPRYERKAPAIKTGKAVLSKLNAKLDLSAGWKGTKGTRMVDDDAETVPVMYLEFPFHIVKVNVLEYCSEVSRLAFFALDPR